MGYGKYGLEREPKWRKVLRIIAYVIIGALVFTCNIIDNMNGGGMYNDDAYEYYHEPAW